MNAIMYGAGNIGRGFIGQIFYESGFHTTFIDVNTSVVDLINKDHEYPIYVTKKTGYEPEWVRNVDAVNGRDNDAVVNAIAQTDIMATALGVNILPFVAPLIAKAIEKRMETGRPLNILICENLIGSNDYLRGLILKTLSPSALDFFEKNIGLVCVSVGRTVPPTLEKFLAVNPLAICADEYSELPVDLAGFRPAGAELPKIKGMIPFSPFQFFIERKLLIHNMGHAMIAYLGRLKGYDYIYRSVNDPEVKYFVFRALIESAGALSMRHNVPTKELNDFAEHLMIRYENKLLVDTLERVGKDTKRKLGAGDRLVGAFNCVKEQGGVPAHIAIGIAAGLLFDPENDAAALEVSSCAANEGVKVALAKYSGITDEADVKMIEKFYVMLKEKAPFADFCDVISDLKP